MSSPPPPASPPPARGEPDWDLGDALGYGWAKLQANISQLVLAMLVVLAACVVAGGLSGALRALLLDAPDAEFDPRTGDITVDDRSGFLVTLVVNALLTAMTLVVVMVVASGIIRAALAITEGREVRLSVAFATDKVAPVAVTSLVVGALTFAGTLLCYLPGLLVGFLTSYALFFVLDRDLAPVEAVKASVALVRDNLGPTLLWYVVGGFAALLGALACGVGLLLTVPLVLVATAFTYKRLTGQPVAP